MSIIDDIKKAGLNEYEARAYYNLLFLGQGSAREVSKESGVPRTRVFDALASLESKGLIEKINESPKIWRALNPDLGLRGFIESKVGVYKQLEDQLVSNLKEIKPAVKHEIANKVYVRGGMESILVSQLELTRNNWQSQDILSAGEQIPTGLEIEYARAIKRGVVVRFMCSKYDETNADIMKRRARAGWRVRHVLNEPQDYSFAVYDEKTFFIMLKDPKDPKERIAVIFENEGFSKAIRTYYDELWKSAQPVK